MIKINNINISFDGKECIRSGKFEAYNGQLTGIYGESATGKTSLLNIIGMLSNSDCHYSYNDKPLELNEDMKIEFRNKNISFVTQNSLLIETISVEKNIEFYIEQSDTEYNCDELLNMFNISNKKNEIPKKLSGGERQRAAIACAIAKNSQILLGDEITASLDDDNKKIVMNALNQYAKKGNIIILVSHEKNILKRCDRLYKLEYLELVLEKEKEDDLYSLRNKSYAKKTDAIKFFQLLFLSNKKTNYKRKLISLIIMLFLFFSGSLFVQGYNTSLLETFSVNNIAKTKLLVLNDESGDYRNSKYGYAIHHIGHNEPFSKDVIKKLENLENINKSYDYYSIPYNMLGKNGRDISMSLKAIRDGKIVDKYEPDIEGDIFKSDYSFSIVPYYPGEKKFKENEGVYINANMSHLYNLKVGDELELEMNIPFAMSRAEEQTVLEVDGKEMGDPYYPVMCVGEQEKYKTKVAGIYEENFNYNSELFLQYNIIEEMINRKAKEYEKGNILIDNNAFEGYSRIEELKPYAKVLFIDKEENVLKVNNNINDQSNDVYTYSEYQSVLELKEQNDDLVQNTITLAIGGVVIFILGSIVLEFFYLKKYKSVYMMLNLIGFNKREKRKIYILHSLWQMFNMFFMAMIIYITASVPYVIIKFNVMSQTQIYDNMPDLYAVYMNYGEFSILHFILFSSFVIGVVGVGHLFMKKYYDKQDIVHWMRGG